MSLSPQIKTAAIRVLR